MAGWRWLFPLSGTSTVATQTMGTDIWGGGERGGEVPENLGLDSFSVKSRRLIDSLRVTTQELRVTLSQMTNVESHPGTTSGASGKRQVASSL